jgi:RNA polymerase sigma-70 factor (ECF subfamily)
MAQATNLAFSASPDKPRDGTPDQPEPERSDDDLVAAAQRDRHAFAPLYARYQPRVYAFALRRLGDADRADDVTSQVFVRVLKALPAYEAGKHAESFQAWLFTITRNVVTDTHRRERAHLPVTELEAVADSGPDPMELAIATEARAQLRHLLDALTPTQRRIVELRLGGLTGQEIADRLGMSLAATKSAQYRAFARLRDAMQRAEPDQRPPRGPMS